MKTKLLTLVLFASLTFGFISCHEEDVTPVQDETVDNQTSSARERGLQQGGR